MFGGGLGRLVIRSMGMKHLMAGFIVMLFSLAEGFAGPWYTLQTGLEYGDQVQNEIGLPDRIYFFRRPTVGEGMRNENYPIKIVKASPGLTLGPLLKELQKSFPADFPQRYFVLVFRPDNPDTGYYEGAPEMLKSKRLLQARDVIWIGYSK